MRKIAFYTLGCKVNQYETEILRKELLKYYEEVNFLDSADIYIINTCTVTETAEKKSIKIIKRAVKNNPESFVIVTGCLAEINNFELKKIEGVDMVIPQKEKEKIPEIVKQIFGTTYKRNSYIKKRTRVFVKVQDGCNKFCSYCIIPYARGRSVSRSEDEILKEIKEYLKEGTKEIVLTGICLGEYGKDLNNKISLANLLEKIENLDKDFRIRISSIELKDIDKELKKFIFNSKKICHHFHIPLQSGDKKILKLMNRNYTPEEYLETVNEIRNNLQDVAITTDIMVGFPEEKDKEFENTLKFVEKIKFYKVHIFPYSERKYTKASEYKNFLNKEILEKRCKILFEITSSHKKEFEEKFIGKTLDVLVEDFDKELKLLNGLSNNYIRVFFPPLEKIDLKGDIVSVKIKEVKNIVYGEVENELYFL
jgi:threonylcarbamoyladenosine tRNA methylthiotransferase MtaB